MGVNGDGGILQHRSAYRVPICHSDGGRAIGGLQGIHVLTRSIRVDAHIGQGPLTGHLYTAGKVVRPLICEAYLFIQIFAESHVQIGGQGDVEAGLRQAAVRVLNLISGSVRHAFVARAAGIDGDVGGGDEHFIHVRHVVMVAVLAPHGVEGGGAGGGIGVAILEDHFGQVFAHTIGLIGDVRRGPAHKDVVVVPHRIGGFVDRLALLNRVSPALCSAAIVGVEGHGVHGRRRVGLPYGVQSGVVLDLDRSRTYYIRHSCIGSRCPAQESIIFSGRFCSTDCCELIVL